jgi:hypothetical protein
MSLLLTGFHLRLQMKRKLFYISFLSCLLAVLGFVQVQQINIDKKCTDPYGICKKKIPVGNNFRKLVPPSVCKWKRIYFKSPTALFDGEAKYTNENDTVFMLFSLQGNAASVNSVFQTIKKEAIEGDNLVSKEEPPSDPAWLKVGKGQHVFFAWTRNNFIFSCESGQGWNALGAFMKCFPY